VKVTERGRTFVGITTSIFSDFSGQSQERARRVRAIGSIWQEKTVVSSIHEVQRTLEVRCTLLYFATMAKLIVGQKAPNVQLQTLEGEVVTMASLWGNGRSALLIFLRHLA